MSIENLQEVSSVHEDLDSRTATTSKVRELQEFMNNLEPSMVEGLIITVVVRQNPNEDVLDENGGIPTDVYTHCLGPMSTINELTRMLIMRIMQAQIDEPHSRNSIATGAMN
jgi:hypothetical protein